MVFDALDDISDNDLGFDEVIIHAKAFGTLFVAVLAQSRKHNNLEVGCLGRIAQDVQYVEAADLRHHDVEKYEVGLVAQGSRECVFPIRNAADIKAFAEEAGLVDIRDCVIIFD